MLKIYKKSKVCVIGNGISLRGSGIGKKINSYENVIRCNFYEISGYEQDVGEKTTHWLVTVSCALKPQIANWSNCSSYKEVWVTRSWQPPFNEAIVNCLKNVNAYKWIDFRGNLKEWFDSEARPTTGLVGIATALSIWGPPIDMEQAKLPKKNTMKIIEHQLGKDTI